METGGQKNNQHMIDSAEADHGDLHILFLLLLADAAEVHAHLESSFWGNHPPIQIEFNGKFVILSEMPKYAKENGWGKFAFWRRS